MEFVDYTLLAVEIFRKMKNSLKLNAFSVPNETNF